MSIKNNIIANYVSQIYCTVIGIIMVPLYIRYMGTESYGLVGFYALMQTWFQLLDVGLTPTMAREVARYQGGAIDALTLRRIMRVLERIFIVIALLGGLAIYIGAGEISGRWLKVESLPLLEVKNVIELMGFIVALRWASGLYKGVINGFERLVWLSAFSSSIATARYILVIPLIIYISSSPVCFFRYQLFVAAAELIFLVVQSYRLAPTIPPGTAIRWEFKSLKNIMGFSLILAFTNTVWVLVTQTDKLLLSKLLPLSEYAYFSIAVLVASGVMVISGPISAALLPRMTKLAAEGNEAGLISLYRMATQLLCVVVIPVTLILAFFAPHVLMAWTGKAEIASKASTALTLYAIGNGVLGIAAFPYYLQYAKGDLKLHLIGNIIFVMFLIPMIFWATLRHGVTGAGYAWLTANSLYFLLWAPLVHKKFVKGLHLRWMFEDIGCVLVSNMGLAVLFYMFFKGLHSRIEIVEVLILMSILLHTVSIFSATMLRKFMIDKLKMLFLRLQKSENC